MTRWRHLLAVAALVCCGVAAAIEPLPFKNEAQRERFQNLTSQLRCMVCQNEDLNDSNADLARDMRKQIFDMMQAGKSDDEIKAYLVARYSDFVLYKPPLHRGTWLLWFGPALILVAGAAGAIAFLRRRERPHAGDDASVGDDW